ncbi:CDP-alcohol phosphatidyltransferase family protein [Psychroflexus planctonicus]|uniref:CDP-alcohol phosphatidyltransferase family protein n=1 Tax=Psychroflexus planctonicus TaxID=1526575 RepID=UPI001663425E|nr:CDP-alcohol phosphatidyltransferase family protein [Psychroflexus planctonicus]
MKKHIPNLITALNLLSGIVATFMAVEGQFEQAALFVALGIFFDFFDGLAARLLKVESPIGVQLDSLADMVTSGLVPGIVLFKLLDEALTHGTSEFFISTETHYLAYMGFIVTLASAYRLAKFNIDERQTSSFIGLPTPANTLLILSFPLIAIHQPDSFLANAAEAPIFLVAISIISAYLLNSNFHLFALKFKNLQLKENLFRYLLIIGSMILLFFFQFAGVPLIILFYIILSIAKEAKN